MIDKASRGPANRHDFIPLLNVRIVRLLYPREKPFIPRWPERGLRRQHHLEPRDESHGGIPAIFRRIRYRPLSAHRYSVLPSWSPHARLSGSGQRAELLRPVIARDLSGQRKQTFAVPSGQDYSPTSGKRVVTNGLRCGRRWRGAGSGHPPNSAGAPKTHLRLHHVWFLHEVRRELRRDAEAFAEKWVGKDPVEGFSWEIKKK